MKIKVNKGQSIRHNRKDFGPDSILDVSDKDGALFVSMNIASEVIPPKPVKQAKIVEPEIPVVEEKGEPEKKVRKKLTKKKKEK